MTVTFLEVSACIVEKWVWFTCITEGKRLECEFRQCCLQVMMSVSRCMLLHNVWPLVVWFNILVTSVLPNSNIGMANKIIECIINSDCISAVLLFSWTCLVHKEFESSHLLLGAWMAWHKTICCLDQECIYIFYHFCHCTHARITQIYGDLHRQHINTGPLE